MHFAEQAGQRACDPACSAAYFQNSHLLGIFALADVDHVGEDLLGNSLLAGAEEFLVGPILLASADVVAGVLSRALVPVSAHFFELFVEFQISHYILL